MASILQCLNHAVWNAYPLRVNERRTHHVRSQTTSRKIRLVRACGEGRQERAGVLRESARMESRAVPDGRLYLRDDPDRRHTRHDDRRLRAAPKIPPAR